MEENQANNVNPLEKKMKYGVIALASVVVILAIVLIWVWIDRKGMINDLNDEKDALTEQMVQLQTDYSLLSSNNDTLNYQLELEKEKVEQLIGRVKSTEATNRRKIRQYEKELGTLRSIMRSYIVQIDSLNTLNTTLRADAAKAREEARSSRKKYDDLKSTTDEFAKQVEKGSVLKGRGFNFTAITVKGKETNRSSRVDKLKTCVALVENEIAQKGERDIYIRIKGPDGILMTESQDQIFEVDGEKMIYSASRMVDYQGAEIEICIYFDSTQKFVKGVYTVDIYTTDGKIGSADLLLK